MNRSLLYLFSGFSFHEMFYIMSHKDILKKKTSWNPANANHSVADFQLMRKEYAVKLF